MDNNYEKYEKLANLLYALTEHNTIQHKIIIFCQTKIGVDTLEKSMRNDNILSQQVTLDVRGIHGDKQQHQRDEIYRKFKMPMSECYFESQMC